MVKSEIEGGEVRQDSVPDRAVTRIGGVQSKKDSGTGEKRKRESNETADAGETGGFLKEKDEETLRQEKRQRKAERKQRKEESRARKEERRMQKEEKVALKVFAVEDPEPQQAAEERSTEEALSKEERRQRRMEKRAKKEEHLESSTVDAKDSKEKKVKKRGKEMQSEDASASGQQQFIALEDADTVKRKKKRKHSISG